MTPGAAYVDNTERAGWFWPTGARKCHATLGEEDDTRGTALCRKWARVGIVSAAPIQAPLDAPPSTDDCVTCRRRLTERQEREERARDVAALERWRTEGDGLSTLDLREACHAAERLGEESDARAIAAKVGVREARGETS